jgi:adenylate cyclase
MSAQHSPGRVAGRVALWGGILAVAAIYLFASRPEPLADGRMAGRTVPIEKVFRILAGENDAVRALWTADIVGAGVKAGLKFDEKWRERDVAAGPLPALFLRESATALPKSKVPLGLFLGSDFPIAQSNLFTGVQAERFQRVRATGEPEFFHAADIGRHTAMFPDLAVAPGCVSCHNEHPSSPKTDWKLKDLMGATTWTYPKEAVTLEEVVQIVAALRSGFATAYDGYLAKTATFEKPPEIGARWPREGYYLPTRDVFMREFERRASANTVDRLLRAHEDNAPAKSSAEPAGAAPARTAASRH